MKDSRWLLPFTFGVDMLAIDSALGLAEAHRVTLVAASLIVAPQGKGPRLEHIQQSKDFLEAIKFRARGPISIERYEIWTTDPLETLERLPHELGCESMLLVSRNDRAVLLDQHEALHMLRTLPAPLMHIQIPERVTRDWLCSLTTLLRGMQRKPEPVACDLDMLTEDLLLDLNRCNVL